ncbi:MAG TPA: alkaline phosphatase family protein [Terriglobales bacterium]|nr:alkaline phosphatase family protein [Terriglobales bacterium]
MRTRQTFVSITFALSFLALCSTGSAQAASPCPLSTTNPSVTVCTPTPNALVQSAVNVVAGTTDTNTVTAVQIYLDNKLYTTVHANSVNTFVTVPIGYHLITVQAWDSTGATFKTNVPVAMQPPCALNQANQSMTICSLVPGSVVSQPFHVVAAANDTNPVQSMTLFIDGVGKGGISNSAILDMYVSNLTVGSHSIAVQAQDSTGVLFKQRFDIKVTAASQGLANLKHIIFFAQENRGFDDYFGMLGQYKASLGLANDVDGLNLNAAIPNTQSQLVHPFHYQTVCTENLSPSWNESHADVDGGLMDGFMRSSTSVPSTIDPTGTRAMGYYTQADLPYYYELAARFATSDRWFSPVLTNTIPNRFYLFTATSWGNAFPVNPPSGGFTQPTIFDHLDQAGVSWRYYYQDGPSSALIQQFSTYRRDAAKVVPISNWATDLQNPSTLPSVIFIERAGVSGLDEHPGANIQKGAADAANIINTFINSPSWPTSAFILTYDEGGGLYEHVLPGREIKPDNLAPILRSTDKPGDFNQTGFRVPLVVVSPWVKPSFVSHTTRDYTSILRLIEDTFNVAPLTLRDKNADNMMEFFDFSAGPRLLTPPPLPAQPTNGTCNNNLEKAPGF